MAIDTLQKRASAINISLPFRGLWPMPDGGVSQEDRQQTDFMYTGILAGGSAPPTVLDCFYHRRYRRISWR